MHRTSEVVVARADSYSNWPHVDTSEHLRSDVEVAAVDSYSKEEHVVSGVQPRSRLEVGGYSSHSALEQVVSFSQTRFELPVGLSISYSSGVHVVSTVHSRSELPVAAIVSCSLSGEQVVLVTHLRSLVVVWGVCFVFFSNAVGDGLAAKAQILTDSFVGSRRAGEDGRRRGGAKCENALRGRGGRRSIGWSR